MAKQQIVARFSNGFEDAYNGTRAVKAAWMITRRSDGAVMASGHSLDRAKAQKTADGKIYEFVMSSLGYEGETIYHLQELPRQYATRQTALFWREENLKHGLAVGNITIINKARREHNARRRAIMEQLVDIEVVDL